MKTILIIILLAIVGGFFNVNAQQPIRFSNERSAWHNIGEMAVDLSKDKDELVALVPERLNSIKFRVMHGALILKDLEIFYDIGEKQDVHLDVAILDLTESRAIGLNGGERKLKKIIFHYKPLPKNTYAKAYIELWGIKDNSDKS